MIRPENKALNENQKRRVLEKVKEQGFTCGSCGSDDFEVGKALYLGFLLLDKTTTRTWWPSPPKSRITRPLDRYPSPRVRVLEGGDGWLLRPGKDDLG